MGNFNNTLKYLRTCKKMSQAELADKLGVSTSTVGMYELGKREPNFKTLGTIADLFNVDANFLLGKLGENFSCKDEEALHIGETNLIDKKSENFINKENLPDWNYKNVFARNLKYFMAQKRISQMDLANALQLSQSAVSDWCTGKKMPRIDKINTMCILFNCSRSDLMDHHPQNNYISKYRKEVPSMPLPKQHAYTSEDYWNLPDGQRAELIDGQLYNMAPPSRIHQRLVSQFTRVIGQYIADHHGSCQVYPAPFAVNLDADDKDWVEPDISVICDHNKLTDRGCTGAPDWIIEIVSPSSSRMDYYKKMNLYLDAGVRVYWIVDPIRERTTVCDFSGDNVPVMFTFSQTVAVSIYPDLAICIDDLLNG